MADWILPYTLFAFTMSITPGPNNVMVTASGAAFGVRRTVPHMLGVSVGFPVMLAVVASAYESVVTALPAVERGMTWVGTAFLLYIAWRIATAAPDKLASGEARPLSIWQGAAFQWVNPKAWMIALASVATYGTGDGGPLDAVARVFGMGVIFFVVCMPSLAAWTVLGSAIGRWLGTGARFRAFNLAMALLLVASVILPLLPSL
jgi:threonine/homoserine/homoserine lactone efflux protein